MSCVYIYSVSDCSKILCQVSSYIVSDGGEILGQVSSYSVSDASVTVVRFGVVCLHLQRV